MFFFFKQKTAYEMRISDWSSDVCSSDLPVAGTGLQALEGRFEIGGGVGLERADADVGVARLEQAAAPAGQLDGAEGDADLQRLGLASAHAGRSEEGRVGEAWVSTCRSRGGPATSKKKKQKNNKIR